MKVVYYFVTFVASLMIISFVSWETYQQWPVIQATVTKAVAPAPKKCDDCCAPGAKRKCECSPCPKGGCEDCTCSSKK
jgi:hypothetical protein